METKPQVEREVVVRKAQGLHARPAAMFVQQAAQYDADISVTKDGETVNAKSIMGILTLGVMQGQKVTLKATGADAQKAVDELADYLSREDD